MKKIICGAALFAILAAILAPGLVQAAQEKPRVGVLRFTNHTSAGWWSASVGRELSDMLASELVSQGSFEVLERGEIDAVLGEQDLGEGGRLDAATKAKIGKIKGAKYLVAGTVSSYEQNTSGGGGGVSIGGLSLGGKKEKTYVAVDVKVIDTETGEIVDARTIEGEASGSGMGGSLSIAGVSLHGGGFEKTPAGKAIRGCIVYISDYLECSLVRGKDDRCMQKWDDMDKARRERTRGAIDIR
jgi:curli biogenesis system outer membrane secretion channel CsgG